MNEISKLVEQGYNRIAEDYYNHRNISKFNSELETFLLYEVVLCVKLILRSPILTD